MEEQFRGLGTADNSPEVHAILVSLELREYQRLR